MKLKGTGDVGGYFEFGNVGSYENGNGLAIFDGDLHLLKFLAILDCFDGEYFIKVVFLAFGEGLHFDFEF